MERNEWSRWDVSSTSDRFPVSQHKCARNHLLRTISTAVLPWSWSAGLLRTNETCSIQALPQTGSRFKFHIRRPSRQSPELKRWPHPTRRRDSTAGRSLQENVFDTPPQKESQRSEKKDCSLKKKAMDGPSRCGWKKRWEVAFLLLGQFGIRMVFGVDYVAVTFTLKNELLSWNCGNFVRLKFHTAGLTLNCREGRTCVCISCTRRK